jgi:sortase A
MSQPSRSRFSRAGARSLLRSLERLLLAVGLVCLVLYANACAQRALFQSRAEADFERALAEQMHSESPDQSEWSPERRARWEQSRGSAVQALGRLEIPVAGVSVMLLEGTDDTTLDRGVGRIEGTARPGEPGNLGIAGHRDGFFRGLRRLSIGDEIQLSSLAGLARYRVTDLRVVSPRAVDVLEPTSEPSLTLVTCHPFYFVGDAPERFIVRARQEGFEPWSRSRQSEHATR